MQICNGNTANDFISVFLTSLRRWLYCKSSGFSFNCHLSLMVFDAKDFSSITMGILDLSCQKTYKVKDLTNSVFPVIIYTSLMRMFTDF